MDAGGRRLAAVSCDGPWILVRPSAPGAYSFDGWLPGIGAKPRHGVMHAPAKGQTRLVLQFPDA